MQYFLCNHIGEGYSVFDLTHLNAKVVWDLYIIPIPLVLLKKRDDTSVLHPHPQPSPLVFPLVFTYPFPSAVSKATMYTFPSPPSSPIQHHVEDDDVAAVVCGTCDKPLEKDWFCINCHQRCTTCSRILGQDEHCTRCWAYDTLRNVFVRKPAAALNTPPSPPLTMTAYFPCNSF